jgi:hypothetical protein
MAVNLNPEPCPNAKPYETLHHRTLYLADGDMSQFDWTKDGLLKCDWPNFLSFGG